MSFPLVEGPETHVKQYPCKFLMFSIFILDKSSVYKMKSCIEFERLVCMVGAVLAQSCILPKKILFRKYQNRFHNLFQIDTDPSKQLARHHFIEVA